MSLSPENESIAVACRIFIVFGTSILVALTLIYTGAILQGLTKQIIITHVYLTVEYFSSPTARTHSGTKCANDSEVYCQNEGKCFIVEDVGVKACQCPEPYGGKRCEKYPLYHEIHLVNYITMNSRRYA